MMLGWCQAQRIPIVWNLSGHQQEQRNRLLLLPGRMEGYRPRFLLNGAAYYQA